MLKPSTCCTFPRQRYQSLRVTAESNYCSPDTVQKSAHGRKSGVVAYKNPILCRAKCRWRQVVQAKQVVLDSIGVIACIHTCRVLSWASGSCTVSCSAGAWGSLASDDATAAARQLTTSLLDFAVGDNVREPRALYNKQWVQDRSVYSTVR
jgi:hypothetical protein